MRNLLAFLSRHRFFILFLIFMIISFTLVFQNNYYHRSRVIGTTNRLTGNLNRIYADITGYLTLKKSNEQLSVENALLRSLLEIRAPAIPDSLVALQDNLMVHYISAKVISNSVHSRNNYFMLDKGWRSGIRKDMGVVTANGVVGLIIDVSENFSSGISVLHKDSKVSGRIKKNDQLVNISWDGLNYRLGTIAHIPAHISLQPGDTILTSGNSRIFPEGIMIGTVEYIEDEMENMFKKGKILFAVDYNRLTHVYVVDNTFRDEIDRLNTSMPDE